MLADGQELDMRIAHLFDIGWQFLRQFFIRKKAPAFFCAAAPGTQVHFINRQRSVKRLAFFAAVQPVGILPLILVQIEDNRGSCRAHFGIEAVWVGALGVIALEVRDNGILITFTHAKVRDKEFPNAAIVAALHGMPSPIPLIEIADDADALRARCPDDKMHPLDAIYLAWVRAHLLVDLMM